MILDLWNKNFFDGDLTNEITITDYYQIVVRENNLYLKEMKKNLDLLIANYIESLKVLKRFLSWRLINYLKIIEKNCTNLLKAIK